jgi:hypothetical protein
VVPQYVQKIRVPVRLARIGAPPLAGLVSLCPRAELHDGPETLLECLNASPRILPFQLADGNAVLLVSRSHIEWAEPDATMDPRLVRPAPYLATREELVRVRLAGGETLEGIISMEMPDQFNRPSDYLNGDEAFFPLTMPLGTRLLNKARVLDVLVRVAGPLPKAA